MFESCTMSLAYAKYSFLEMWVEALPGTAILFGCIYAGKFCTYYWQEAGRWVLQKLRVVYDAYNCIGNDG